MKATVAANIAQLGRYAVKTAPANANGYRARVRDQCLSWAMGKPYHNKVDGECCPDFSCCVPDMFEKDEAKRWEHYRAHSAD